MTISNDTGEAQYKGLIGLLAVYSDASNRLAELQARADASLLETVDGERKEWAELSAAFEQADKAIKDLVAKHPEWTEGRTIKTPYGQVRFTRTTKLDVPSPETTVSLIRAKLKDADPEQYIRVKEEPNLDALGTLDKSTLARLGIIWQEFDSISIKPAKVDLGKTAGKKGEKVA